MRHRPSAPSGTHSTRSTSTTRRCWRGRRAALHCRRRRARGILHGAARRPGSRRRDDRGARDDSKLRDRTPERLATTRDGGRSPGRWFSTGRRRARPVRQHWHGRRGPPTPQRTRHGWRGHPRLRPRGTSKKCSTRGHGGTPATRYASDIWTKSTPGQTTRNSGPRSLNSVYQAASGAGGNDLATHGWGRHTSCSRTIDGRAPGRGTSRRGGRR